MYLFFKRKWLWKSSLSWGKISRFRHCLHCCVKGPICLVNQFLLGTCFVIHPILSNTVCDYPYTMYLPLSLPFLWDSLTKMCVGGHKCHEYRGQRSTSDYFFLTWHPSSYFFLQQGFPLAWSPGWLMSLSTILYSVCFSSAGITSKGCPPCSAFWNMSSRDQSQIFALFPVDSWLT